MYINIYVTYIYIYMYLHSCIYVHIYIYMQAVQLAEKEDEIAVLQRKVREATHLEKIANKQNAEISSKFVSLQKCDAQLHVSVEEVMIRIYVYVWNIVV